jgi:hypothetical protein
MRTEVALEYKLGNGNLSVNRAAEFLITLLFVG